MARQPGASARDLAELATGKGSARDRAEAGRRARSKVKKALKSGRGGPTKRRRRSGR